MKKCFKCGVEKPIDDFYRHPQMGDGHLNKCKDCAKKDVKNNYRSHYDQYKLYESNRTQRLGRKLKKLAYQQKHREKYPERYKARQAVGNAIRDGRLAYSPCEICGEKAEAHHADYSKPLDVRWLCFFHHRLLEHKQLLHRF